MGTYLLTVRESQRLPDGVRLLPGLYLGAGRACPAAIRQMKQGSKLELRCRDGRVLCTHLMSYGVAVEKTPGGELVFRGDPSDPEILLTLPAEVGVEDVQAGTEVWLV